MTKFEVLVLFGIGMIVLSVLYLANVIDHLRKDVSEIWRRMPRID